MMFYMFSRRRLALQMKKFCLKRITMGEFYPQNVRELVRCWVTCLRTLLHFWSSPVNELEFMTSDLWSLILAPCSKILNHSFWGSDLRPPISAIRRKADLFCRSFLLKGSAKKEIITLRSLWTLPAPPALLNRVPFGCSTGVAPGDGTGARYKIRKKQ